MMLGLYLYPEQVLGGIHLENAQFEADTFAHIGNPLYDMRPDSVSGTPQDDQIIFNWSNKYLYLEVHQFWERYFALGVTQRRIPERKGADGETIPAALILEVRSGAAGGICRVCWDIADRRTGGTYKETATGVVSVVATVASYQEQWQFVLWRGDYLLRNGVLEASTRGYG